MTCEQLRAALRDYMEHDLGGVHLDRGEDREDIGYESCEHIHYRLGHLAYPDKAAEYAEYLAAYPDRPASLLRSTP